MSKTLFTLLASLALAPSAFAQADPDVPRRGTWAAVIRADDGSRIESRVVLTEFSGAWHGPLGKTAKGSCRQRSFPITVQNSTQGDLAFTVWGSQVAPGCPNLAIDVKPVDANAFEGSVDSVGSIKLTHRR